MKRPSARKRGENWSTRKNSGTRKEAVTLADIQNPQHEPGSEKRLMLVFLLTFIVMLAFQPLFKRYFPQPATPPQQSQPAQTQPATTTAASAVPSVGPATTSVTGVTKQAAIEAETVIEN